MRLIFAVLVALMATPVAAQSDDDIAAAWFKCQNIRETRDARDYWKPGYEGCKYIGPFYQIRHSSEAKYLALARPAFDLMLKRDGISEGMDAIVAKVMAQP